MSPQRPAPGADEDRAILRAQMAQVEDLIQTRASSPWCRKVWSASPCPCWKCSALRIIRYAPR